MSYKNVVTEQPKKDNRIEFFHQIDNHPHTPCCTAHIHSAVELLYIKEGSYHAILDGKEHELEQGDMILFCSNAIHHVVTKQESINSYYVIKVPATSFLDFANGDNGKTYIMRFALNRKEQKNIWTREELKKNGMRSIIEEMIRESEIDNFTSEIGVKLKVMELLLSILRESVRETEIVTSQTTSLIYEAMIYARKHYSEDIDQKALASDLGMSYSYFSRKFKAVMGMTFREFLNQTRINHAEQLLYRSNDTITEIATKCGYNSPSYFISVYKALTGKTPYSVLQQLK